MWPNRRVIELFKVEHPILLAPMAGAIDYEIAAEVAEGGGLASIPCAMLTPEKLREQFDGFRTKTNEPINFNFFCHQPPQSRQCARGCLARMSQAVLPGAWHRSGRTNTQQQSQPV